MLQIMERIRCYCKFVNKNKIIKLADRAKQEKLNFKQLNNPSKVPQQSVVPDYKDTSEADSTIDAKRIQLLERLSLVDLESKDALSTLKSSIQFADKIANIDTAGVLPLYTVLESQNLQLRADHVTEGRCRKDLLLNAKETDEDYFVAPPGNIPLEQEEKHFKD